MNHTSGLQCRATTIIYKKFNCPFLSKRWLGALVGRQVHASVIRVRTRVNLTGGNRSGLTGYRSNRSGPVPAGTQPAKIQILNLNSKNEKFPKKILKILQGVMNLMVSNFLKNSFIQYSLWEFKVKSKRKRKMGRP